MRVLVVALGGAIGASARYLLGGVVHQFTGPAFPYGTFVVNILGCLLFGAVAGLSEERFVIGPMTRTFLPIGILGGFTTFSSYTFETFGLLRDGQHTRALVNAVGQVIVGLVSAFGPVM